MGLWNARARGAGEEQLLRCLEPSGFGHRECAIASVRLCPIFLTDILSPGPVQHAPHDDSFNAEGQTALRAVQRKLCQNGCTIAMGIFLACTLRYANG